MKELLCLLILFTLTPCRALSDEGSLSRVRKLRLKRDDIALVRTAVGIATIIQLQDRPTSVVLGDTNAFKVEYLDSAITIKPLTHSSKSNLYIYTEARRFNVSLIAVTQAASDYIVYLQSESSFPDSAKERWRAVNLRKSANHLTIIVDRLGRAETLLMASFTISSTKQISFSPSWIWLTQKGRTVPIQSLSLSGVKLDAGNRVQGLLSVKLSDLQTIAEPLHLEICSQNRLSLQLPGVNAWTK